MFFLELGYLKRESLEVMDGGCSLTASRKASRRRHGGVTEASRRHHGGITEASRRHHGGITEVGEVAG
jgi:thymidylate synthase ThyX